MILPKLRRTVYIATNLTFNTTTRLIIIILNVYIDIVTQLFTYNYIWRLKKAKLCRNILSALLV